MDIFYILSLILPILFLLFYFHYNSLLVDDEYICPTSNVTSIVYLLLFTLCMAFFGAVDGSDKLNYKLLFDNIDSIIQNDYKDVGWYMYVKSFHTLIDDSNIFFFVNALLYSGMYYYFGVKKYTNEYACYFLICATGMMGFFGYGTNTIRNGLALGVFIFALSLEKYWKQALLFIIAITLHKASILLVSAYLVANLYRKKEVYLLFWILCLVASASGFSLLNYTSFFEDDRIEKYSQILDSTYNTGFRIDFIIYSVIPIIIVYYWIKKYYIEDRFYNMIFNMYLILNSFWLLIIRIIFTNRWAYFSWFMIPILIAYPFLSSNIYFPVRKKYFFLISLVFFCVYLALEIRDM